MKMMTQSYFFNQIASESKKIYFSKLPFKKLKKLVNLNPKVALIATFKKKRKNDNDNTKNNNSSNRDNNKKNKNKKLNYF